MQGMEWQHKTVTLFPTILCSFLGLRESKSSSHKIDKEPLNLAGPLNGTFAPGHQAQSLRTTEHLLLMTPQHLPAKPLPRVNCLLIPLAPKGVCCVTDIPQK